MEIKVNGVGTGGGKSCANVYLFNNEDIEIKKYIIDDPDFECKRTEYARNLAKQQIETIMIEAEKNSGSEDIGILDCQLLLIEDDEFFSEIKRNILENHLNSEYALHEAITSFIKNIQNTDNDYLKQRSSDFIDLEKRLLFALNDKTIQDISSITEEFILITKELLPSQIINLNSRFIKGIIMEDGGKTSHTVIIAKSKGIPCIIGCFDICKLVCSGKKIIMDSENGEVNLNPSDEDFAEFIQYQNNLEIKNKEILFYKNVKTKTLDGFEMNVLANISSEQDIDAMLEKGGEGVGLYRTEFMYMSNDCLPSENVQYTNYSSIVQKLKGKPLIIRTLDAGGDKNIEYLNIQKEENPFLGFRGIRYSINNPEIFKVQVSAILRAGINCHIKFMLPMVSIIEELLDAKRIIQEVKNELEKSNVLYNKTVPLGMMIETPSAALMADVFAKEVDFFSVGTNDLTQYLFAADRMNTKVAYLNSYFHPQLLRLIKQIAEIGKKYKIEVDICGQAAENPYLIPIWAAMGINNLSVSIHKILYVKKQICMIDRREIVPLLNKILEFNNAIDCENYLKNNLKTDL